MQNPGKKRLYQMIGAGFALLFVGAALSKALLNRQQVPQTQLFQAGSELQAGAVQIKDINIVKALPPEKRRAKLAEIAQSPETLQQSRARYLLATELLQQGKATKALEQLQGLEKNYPPMAAYVRIKQAQAYEQTGDRAKAQTSWQDVVKHHAKDAPSAEALYSLGKMEGASKAGSDQSDKADSKTDKVDSKYWDQAIAQFPSHPRTVEIAQQRLQKNPNQLELLLLVAQHGLYVDNYIQILDRLVDQHAAQLTAENWEAIAFGYWENQQYGKAGIAYSKAPFTARNAYRTARGLQLGEKPGATDAYIRMVNAFPKDPETGLALIRLSKITAPDVALKYIDQVISYFPTRTGEALAQKAKLLDEINSKQAATQTRQMLLSNYGSSEAAAELRWTQAEERAQAGDLQTALKWATPITKQNPDSEFAPEAAFWVGKWASQLGKQQDAQTAFEYVLTRYPHSYYAWRSASMLGWDVGDFSSVRDLKPAVARPTSRPELPVGSDTLKELYQLGQDQDAWKLWQTEFRNPEQPTVDEQFTDGLMRQAVGDNLDGIFMVSHLSQRENPEERQEYKQLKQEIGYWYALYPFPFLEPIESWSQERQLNPLLVTALIRQESRFMPNIKSSAGAVGLMQVMPDTGAWIAQKIKLKEYQLDNPDDNIKLGTWYLDYTHDEYANNSMLAVASYNAGPGAVGDWVAKKGIADPDQFVETIPYSETRGYVKSVFENYWNYLRLYNPEISQKLAQVSQSHPTIE
jgi:soluble lytic murein transglycosylase